LSQSIYKAIEVKVNLFIFASSFLRVIIIITLNSPTSKSENNSFIILRKGIGIIGINTASSTFALFGDTIFRAIDYCFGGDARSSNFCSAFRATKWLVYNLNLWGPINRMSISCAPILRVFEGNSLLGIAKSFPRFSNINYRAGSKFTFRTSATNRGTVRAKFGFCRAYYRFYCLRI